MNSLSVGTFIPKGFQIRYPELLYNRPSFLSANNALPQLHFYLLDRKSKEVLGHIAFSREENEVLSPFKAPFGGFELVEGLKDQDFLFFVTEVLRLLKENHIRFIRTHLPPTAYLPGLDRVKSNLQVLGFEEKQKLIHHVLPVGQAPFESQIATMEKRKLNKARAQGCQFQIEDRQHYAAIFEFIKEHRSTKGHELSITWELLREAIKDHIDHYLFCTVRLKGKLIAAAIMVRVNSGVLYYFIPGHDPTFNPLSPMVFLLGEVYDWAGRQGVHSIDLGTSYWTNKENESLVRFKQNLGGLPKPSSVFRKALSS